MLAKLLKTFEYFQAFFSILQNFQILKTFQNSKLLSVTQVTNIFQILNVTQVTLRSNVQEQEEQEQFFKSY